MSTHQALVIIARFIQATEWYLAGVGTIWLACVLYFAGRAIYERLPAARRREAARYRAQRERLESLTREYVARRQ